MNPAQSIPLVEVAARTFPQKRDRLLPGEAPWPRLSETLTGPRHPDQCQKCGRTRDEIDEAGQYLQLWQEHAQDEAARKRTGSDVPEQIFLLLCTSCCREEGDGGKRVTNLVSRHPRFYERIAAFAPLPGTMSLCIDCAWRDGLHCSSPKAKFNGGEGMEVKFPQSTTVHFKCNPSSASGFHTNYPGPPVSCTGREEVEAAATRTANGEAVVSTATLALFGEDIG